MLWPGRKDITYSRVTNTIARLTKKLEEADAEFRIAGIKNAGYFLYTSDMLTAPPVPLEDNTYFSISL